MKLELYVRDPCPLCEHAAEALDQADIGPWITVDISADEQLMQQYRLRIPVLRDIDSGTEIGWPFDAWMLKQCFADLAGKDSDAATTTSTQR